MREEDEFAAEETSFGNIRVRCRVDVDIVDTM
jgi:hypothetical protein